MIILGLVIKLSVPTSAADSTSTPGYFGHISVDSDSSINSISYDFFLKEYYTKSFNTVNYNLFTKQLLQFPLENGCLFPNLTMTGMSPKNESDSLFINPSFILSFGERVIIDTLIFKDLQKTSPMMLYKDLSFLAHQPYNTDVDNLIQMRLKKYSFLTYPNTSEIIKTKDGNFGLLVPLVEEPSNSFTGIVGYVPKTSGSDGYFTGQLDLDLKNIGGKGRGFQIYWSKVNESSQELKLNFFEPHLFGSQFFANMGFDQTLRDTLVILRNFNLGLGNDMSGIGTVEITASYESTLPTPAGQEELSLTKSKIFKGGLKYTYDNRDLSSNPKKGLLFDTHNYLGVHESDSETNIMTQTETEGEINFSLSQNLVLNINTFYQAKFIKDSKLDYGDLLWFGGATSLRGYPEDFFAGCEIGSLGTEIRWITGYYSRIYFFYDQGYYKTTDNVVNLPGSFGIGLRLESRMGIIGLDYAFGEDDTFSTAKIHLHLENRF